MHSQLTRRSLMVVAFGVWSALSLAQPGTVEAQDAAAIREFRGQTMGTTYMVKVSGATELDDQSIRFGVDAELRRVNDQMSTYLETSEISRFNQSASTDWFDVSPEFAGVVAAAQKISRQTDGAFDITVAPLVNAWSFGPTERSHTVPDAEQIRELKELIGYQKLEVRVEPPSLRKSIPQLHIDLSSIAKGHGVDRVVDWLARQGAVDVFVEIGGEVRTSGSKPDGPWRVGIQMPDATPDDVMIAHAMPTAPVGLHAMATSGDYRNHFVVDGKRYSHTIDPRSGEPVRHDLASVTVVAPSCMLADGWATALNVLGMEEGLGIAESAGIHTLLIQRTDDGRYRLEGTGTLSEYAQTDEAEEANGLMQAVVPVAILSFGVFSILLFAMAIGVLFGRKSISGSCGGLANKTNEDGSTSCALCSNPSDACRELREKMAESSSTSSQ